MDPLWDPRLTIAFTTWGYRMGTPSRTPGPLPQTPYLATAPITWRSPAPLLQDCHLAMAPLHLATAPITSPWSPDPLPQDPHLATAPPAPGDSHHLGLKAEGPPPLGYVVPSSRTPT